MKKTVGKEHNQIGDVEVITFTDAAAFDSWLRKNHQAQRGVWLKLARKMSGIPSLTADEAVDVGLCWGWIVNAGFIFPLFAGLIFPVSMPSVEANGPDAKPIPHPI